MTIYQITLSDRPEPYFVDSASSDEAIDELKQELGLDQISGDVVEIVQ